MLIIRSAQIEAFRSHRRQDFLCRLRAFLQQLPQLQAQRWDWKRIDVEATAALLRAPKFHLKRETDIARLAEIFCTRLDGFEGRSIPRDGLAILQAYGVDPEAKLERFLAYLDSEPPGTGP